MQRFYGSAISQFFEYLLVPSKTTFAFKKETNKLVRNVMRILTRFQMANFWRNP